MREWGRKWYKHILALALSAAFLLAAGWKMGIYFQTNDDRYIAEILSGVATGQPDARINCVNYLFTLPLAMLYRITTQIPWYGGCLILFMGLSYFVILHSALSRAEKLREVAGVCFGAAVLFLVQLFMLGQIQFTCVAAFMAMAGYAGLVLYPSRRQGLTVFTVLEFLAFLLRDQAMLMIQPLGGAVFLGILLLKRDIDLRQRVMEGIRYICVIAAVLVIGLGGNAVAYSGQDWQEFKAFNQARVTLFDYHRRFAYEEVEHILDKYDVTRAEYEAYFDYVILGYDIPTSCAEELVEYARSQEFGVNFGQIGAGIQEYFFSDNYRGINDVLVLMWVCALIWALLPGKRRMLLPLAAMFGGHMLVLIYLLWKGRLPLRVSMPFMVCSIYLLGALVWYFYSNRQKSYVQAAVLLVMGGLLLGLGYKSGQVQYRDAVWLNDVESVNIQGLQEINTYCNMRPEQAFFLDTYSMVDYKGSALQTDIYQNRNNRVTGIWYANAPHIIAANEAYLAGKEQGIWLIISENGQYMDRPTIRYFAEATGSEPVQTDSILTSDGDHYAVIYFDGAYHITNE